MSSEKTEEGTAHRRQEERQRGRVANSKELNGAAGFVAVVAYLLLNVDTMADQLRRIFAIAFRQISALGGASTMDSTSMLVELGEVAMQLVLPPLVIGAVVAAAAGAAQTRGMVSFSAIAPDLSRVDPVQGLLNLVSLQVLMQLLKVLIGLLVVGVIIAVMFHDLMPQVLRSGYLPAERTSVVSWSLITKLLCAGALLAVLMGVVDYLFQHHAFEKSLRMSKQEVKDEHKSIEGDPQVKAKQKEFFKELIDESIEKRIAEAQVIVVNPTHVAIAIRYEPGKFDLPLVSVKGLDEVAMAIRTRAEEIGVPIYENRMLARDLYRHCRENEYITNQFFEAVAEVFKWLAKVNGARALVGKSTPRQER